MIASGLTETEFTLEGLEEGNTYYWTVIPHDSFSTGFCIDHIYSFKINTPPITTLAYPSDGDIVPTGDVLLEYMGSDPDLDVLEYYLYLSTDLDEVKNRAENARQLVGPEHTIESPQPGSVYYWTIIAKDNQTLGTCNDGIFSFIVNSPPTLISVGDQEVYAGSEIMLDVNGTDDDESHVDLLEFSLIEGPMNMTIDPDSGEIRWTPVLEEIGSHTVKVQLTDGLDPVNISFQVEVLGLSEEDGEEGDSSSWIYVIVGIIVLVILLVIAALVAFFFIRKGRKEEEEETQSENLETGKIPDFTTGQLQTGATTTYPGSPPGPSAPAGQPRIGGPSSEPTKVQQYAPQTPPGQQGGGRGGPPPIQGQQMRPSVGPTPPEVQPSGIKPPQQASPDQPSDPVEKPTQDMPPQGTEQIEEKGMEPPSPIEQPSDRVPQTETPDKSFTPPEANPPQPPGETEGMDPFSQQPGDDEIPTTRPEEKPSDDVPNQEKDQDH